jgi:HEAT repeat protein
VPHRDKRTLPERVAILEVRNAELERELADLTELKQQVADLQSGVAQLGTGAGTRSPDSNDSPSAAGAAKPAPSFGPFSGKTAFDQAQSGLRSIAEKMQSDLSDPKEIRELMAKVVSLGPPGVEAVKRIAADTANPALRVPAVLLMAFSKDTDYVATLKNLCSDSDAHMRREALTAFVKLGNRLALEDVKRLLSDSDATVAMAAGEAYRQITGETPPPRGSSKAGPTGPPKRAK